MNQAIIFVDRCEYNEQQKRVYFYAQASGQLINCFFQTLKSDREAVAGFEVNRFDYEDLAEKAIEDELFNQQGEIEVEELL